VIWLIAPVVALYVLWVYYLAVMNLKRANDAQKLQGAIKAFAWLVLAPGYLLDALVNFVIVPFILFDIPRGWLVTGTLSYHVKNSTGYRYHVARWFCSTLLDRFDPSGCHCK